MSTLTETGVEVFLRNEVVEVVVVVVLLPTWAGPGGKGAVEDVGLSFLGCREED
jgi:hypothetical protein